jgi:hypothetical protein
VFRHFTSAVGGLALPALGAAALAAQTATLGGTVVADSLGHPVTGADVSIPSLGRRTTTNYLGEFKFSALPGGLLVVSVRRLGFAPFRDTVTIVDGRLSNRDFQLVEQARQLDSVTVTAPERKYISPGLAEFEERRKQGHGHFISEEVLRKSEDHGLVELVLGQIPGLSRFNPDPRRPTATFVRTTRKCAAGPAILGCRGGSSACPVTLYLDGQMIYSAARGDDVPDLNLFHVRDYAGIEYYAGGATAPLKYNVTDSGCGLLLLWTRER